ncbi:MAG: sigma-70 family RNA polymerase sigma factor [Chloroflexi bacterium]|nr:sigma-70 family RNA polymerase sigma factor [Chloroflexota bacterium]
MLECCAIYSSDRGADQDTRENVKQNAEQSPARNAKQSTSQSMDRCAEEWFERARRGDRTATEAVVSALTPRLARMATYYARCSGEDPDDLLQEAWVGLLESLPEVNLSIGSPEQYLIQRAKWRLLNAIRRSKVRRCVQVDELETLLAPEGCSETAAAEAFARDFMRRLTTTQRAVLAYLLAGYTWREAGSALGCTSANVAYHVRQIRRRYEVWSG